jgi:hypothetical protein
MALSTTSSSASASSVVNVAAADACAVVCAASAGVHGALVVPHTHESARMAAAFVVATVALALAAVALAVVPVPQVSVVAAGLLLSVAAAYVLSRTSGIPVLTARPEPFDALGLAVSLGELAAAVVALRHANTRRHR